MLQIADDIFNFSGIEISDNYECVEIPLKRWMMTMFIPLKANKIHEEFISNRDETMPFPICKYLNVCDVEQSECYIYYLCKWTSYRYYSFL